MSEPTRDAGAPSLRAGTARAAVRVMVLSVGLLIAAAAIAALAITSSIALAVAVPGMVGAVFAAATALGGLGLAASVGLGGLLLVSGSHTALMSGDGLPPRWWLPHPRSAPYECRSARDSDPT